MTQLGITTGDPAGIGPEISVRAAFDPLIRGQCGLILFGDEAILRAQASVLNLPFDFEPVSRQALRGTGRLPARGIVHVPARSQEITPGTGSQASGEAAARNIEECTAACLSGRLDAIVTAPLNKKFLKAAGYPFPGHTEFLGALAGAQETRMLFVGGRQRILLATIHVALRRVPDVLTIESLARTLEYAASALRIFRWGARKTVAVLGLNPHAGEEGLFGDEESRIIAPAIERARASGIRAEGPFPADTFFAHRGQDGGLGIVVAMYHDQGLIPAKMGGIGGAANVTLGLPYVRSSVDHGTAFDRAWKRGKLSPDPSGLVMATRVAVDLAARAKGRRLDWAWPSSASST